MREKKQKFQKCQNQVQRSVMLYYQRLRAGRWFPQCRTQLFWEVKKEFDSFLRAQLSCFLDSLALTPLLFSGSQLRAPKIVGFHVPNPWILAIFANSRRHCRFVYKIKLMSWEWENISLTWIRWNTKTEWSIAVWNRIWSQLFVNSDVLMPQLESSIRYVERRILIGYIHFWG